MSGVHWDIGVLLKWWHDPWSFSQASSGDRLILRWDKNARIPSQTKQGNGPTSRVEDGDQELLLICGGILGVPLEGRRGFRGTS